MIDKLLSIGDLAELLGVPPSTVYQWRHKGFGPPAVKVGKFVRFRPSDVAKWIEQRAEAQE